MFVKGKILMTLVFIFTLIFAVNSNYAEASTKANFNNTNAFCTVRISDALMNKRGYHCATVKLVTRSFPGVPTNGKVEIIMRDENGNHIWSGTKNGGVTLKLGNDHRVYRIYVRAYDYGNDTVNSLGNGSKCYTWEFTNAKNCSIS